jgi:hypothetical protein
LIRGRVGVKGDGDGVMTLMFTFSNWARESLNGKITRTAATESAVRQIRPTDGVAPPPVPDDVMRVDIIPRAVLVGINCN